MTKCTSCGASVVWGIVAASGKRMPLDPDPVAGGNVRIIEYDAQGVPRLKVLRKDEIDEHQPRWVSHFSTCPNAARHRVR